ncbi:unnamed protein product [Allacma fusca]|uniref:Uncharacterized protein n=1 Tax=Allacma fusca TaxID=39272 RepID=A0A8J2K2Y6_9HEXA|nr:unnamed protein product [Allacma fusca]
MDCLINQVTFRRRVDPIQNIHPVARPVTVPRDVIADNRREKLKRITVLKASSAFCWMNGLLPNKFHFGGAFHLVVDDWTDHGDLLKFKHLLGKHDD